MILNSPKSRLGIVNLFADFILSKLPKNKHSIIQVVDCQNFFVIKGKTSHNEILDMGNVIDEFKEKFEFLDKRKLTHTIDLLEYNVDMKEQKELIHTFHNSENCSFTHLQIENHIGNSEKSYTNDDFPLSLEDDSYLVVSSEFPHGHSLTQGRLLYYYGKYIMYNIPTNYPVVSLTLGLNQDEEKFFVFDCFTKNEEENLRSAILDVFDFDMTWLNNEMKKVDWFQEITNPLTEYEFLKRSLNDFVII